MSGLQIRQPGPEIRLEIYSHVFVHIRLSVGKRLSYLRDVIHHLRSPSNSLSLLRVCRWIKHEADDNGLSLLLFNFVDMGTMLGLDQLTNMELRTLFRVHHMRVFDTQLILCHCDQDLDGFYSLARMLKLLPGLQFGTLAVLRDHAACRDYTFSYEVLDELTRLGV